VYGSATNLNPWLSVEVWHWNIIGPPINWDSLNEIDLFSIHLLFLSKSNWQMIS